MRRLFVLLAAASFAVTSSYACNQTFDMCMKTAQLAVDSCHNSKSSACACSAGKQLLACYAECPEDPKMFDTEEKQLARVAELCKTQGAELEASHKAPAVHPPTIDSMPPATFRAASASSHSSLHVSAATSSSDHAAAAAAATNSQVVEIPEPIHVQSAPPALEESHAHKSGKDGPSITRSNEKANSVDSLEASALAALLPIILVLIAN
ncbi:hypothetical protein VTP01DRAFT_4665 [Rhizomucor pusillus]|uniref:uncharacterized protein n=1 Tax=Rhizomucor pusillus TaxID=4840 RepID=UPI00374325F1